MNTAVHTAPLDLKLRDPRHSAKLTLCLATVYIVWGSSFLITKIAVTNLPPTLFSGIRFSVAGLVLMAIAVFYRGDPWPKQWINWRHAGITGFFMVFASNGSSTWALQYIPSNQAALLTATSAFWIAGLGVFGRRGHPLTRSAMLGLAISFMGAVLMLIPRQPLSRLDALGQLAVLIGSLSWSIGTLYYRSIETQLSSLMFMAVQMLMGGLMLLCLGLVHGDAAHFSPQWPGLLGMGYLIFFSSCLAYTAYGWLTVNSTPAVIGTYSYVNPAIAAFVGWQFLHEHLSGVQLAGMVIIIIGVCILTRPGGSLTDPKTLAEPKTQ
jgi:drug/metabolite transporter (DMT)-like permease